MTKPMTKLQALKPDFVAWTHEGHAFGYRREELKGLRKPKEGETEFDVLFESWDLLPRVPHYLPELSRAEQEVPVYLLETITSRSGE